MQPLTRLRLQLTAWYGATFAIILAALGALLLVAIERQMSEEMDESLRDAAREVVHAAARREVETVAAGGRAIDALDELRIPERSLYVFDTTGDPIVARAGDARLRPLIIAAARDGSAKATLGLHGDRSLQVYAERFKLASGQTYVAAATADRVELEDRYATLIAIFAAAAFASLLLVAAGGWLLARKATRPVELNIAHMRRFMADAAHELRTPITVLRSRADVTLQRDRSVADYSEALVQMRREAEAMGSVIDDLLTLSRADAGERLLHVERVQLADLALDAVAAAGALAESRGVALRLERADECEVDADAVLIRRLVMILLDNALKFTARGGEVTLEVRAGDGGPAITVRDTGVGITAEELPRVFDRFYRGSEARRHGSGAGLGLSIARWIADAHGALIAITSTPAQGTTVTVSFVGARRLARS